MLVADCSKFGRTAPVRIGHISQVQTFVTDRGLPARLRKIAQDCNVTIIEAMDNHLMPQRNRAGIIPRPLPEGLCLLIPCFRL